MTVKPVPQSSFIWSWSGDTPKAILQLVWPDGSVDKIPAEVSVSEDQGMITYTATAEADDTTYEATKTVQCSYRVQVINGSITSGEKDSYVYGDSIFVAPDEAPEGKSFAGWYIGDELVSTSEVYARCIDRDLILEARFDDDPVEVLPAVSVSDSPRELDAASGKYKTTLSLSWSVPEGYKFVGAGIYRGYATSEPTLETLLEKGTKKATTMKKANGIYNLNVSMAASLKDYGLYYVGYLTYKGPDGKKVTVYTGIGCNEPVS